MKSSEGIQLLRYYAVCLYVHNVQLQLLCILFSHVIQVSKVKAWLRHMGTSPSLHLIFLMHSNVVFLFWDITFFKYLFLRPWQNQGTVGSGI